MTRARLTSFVVTAGILLALNLSTSDSELFGDAAGYWHRAHSFISGGRFSFGGYSDRLRGYSLPLVLCGLQQLAHAVHVEPVTVFRVGSAILGAALISLAFPLLLTTIFDGTASVLSVLIFSGLAVLYWHGHLLHPLSDFPALLLLVTGVLLLPAAPGERMKLWRAGVAGACLALAANMRPVYEIALPVAIGLMVWHVSASMPSKQRLRSVATLVLVVVGAAVVLWPQSIINRRVQGTLNPFAHASADGHGPNLYVRQLAWGVAIQRYETYVRPGLAFGVIFLDADGIDLLHINPAEDPRASLAGRRLSLRFYVRLVRRHPIVFASLYGRHLFNGLDVAYASPYVTRIVPRSLPFALLNYLVLSLALVGGATALRRASFRIPAWSVGRLAAVLSPAVLAVPTAVEPRFFLAPWLIAYGFVFLCLLRSERRAALVRSWWPVAVVMLLTVGAFALASSTYSQIQNAPPKIARWCVWC